MCNHTRVQSHTCTQSAPPQPGAVCVGPSAVLRPCCAPLRPTAASPWQRSGFINGDTAGKRSWRGGRKRGGWLGAGGGQTGGRGGPWEAGVQEGAVCACSLMHRRVWRGVRRAHACARGAAIRGGLGTPAFPRTPSPKVFPAPWHSIPAGTEGCRGAPCPAWAGDVPQRAERGSRGERHPLPACRRADFPSLWLVTAARDRAGGSGSPQLWRGPGPLHQSSDPCSRVLSLPLGGWEGADTDWGGPGVLGSPCLGKCCPSLRTQAVSQGVRLYSWSVPDSACGPGQDTPSPTLPPWRRGSGAGTPPGQQHPQSCHWTGHL